MAPKAKGRIKPKRQESAQAEALVMSDIASLAKVSKSTVSRALAGNPLISERTRERIMQLARDHGYAINPVARSLRLGQTRTIAVLIPLRHAPQQHVYDPFFTEMLAHLGDALGARGYDLLLSKVIDTATNWIEEPIRTRRADGAIVIGQSLEHKAMNTAAASGIPFVVWGAKLPRQKYISVGTDNFEGGALATRHLLDRGHRKIAFLGDHRAPEVFERYRGHVAALDASRLKPNPELDLPVPFGAEEALQALLDLFRRNVSIDGIVAASDLIAMSALRALNEAGKRVPEDVAIVGFDDISLAAYTNPPLTTIRQSIAVGATLLVDKLLDILAGKRVDCEQIAPVLVTRSTT